MARALNISEAGAMALHTMVLLAGAEVPMTARAISERLLKSEAHLSKVLQRLSKFGFVRSVRGPNGGFSLARPAESIIMLEVFEAIDGPVGDVACTWTPPVCDGVSCVFGQLVTEVNTLVREYLSSIRLSELELRGLGRLAKISPEKMQLPSKRSKRN